MDYFMGKGIKGICFKIKGYFLIECLINIIIFF